MGLMQPPMAEAAATEEPDSAPNSMLPRMLACAMEPGILPTNSWAKLTRRLAIPPLFMMLPARMKRGTASREKDSTPEFIFCMVIKVIWSQDRVDMAVTMEETTMLMEMGTPKNSSTPNTAKRITVVSVMLIVLCPP